MRFKQGSKVEVMSKKEVLTGWRGAEIISGNGHTYSVKFDCYPPKTSEVFVERVPRKAIRPYPPPVEGVDSWVAGEVVEVFDDDSWKIATVLQVYGGNYYMIRLLGLSHKLRVHKLHIRVRQSWQNDKWIVMGKGSRNSGDLRFGLLSTSDGYQRMSFQATKANATVTSQGEVGFLAVQNNTGLQGSPIASCRTLKRASPYCSSLLEAHTGNVQKIRAIEKEDRRQRVVPSTVLEKVDAVAYPRENLGETYMHASFNNRINGYNDLGRGKLNGFIGCSIARGSENNDSDSDACSVGSCSAITKSLSKCSTNLLALSCQETDSLSSDAESFCGSGEEEESCSIPPEEEVAAKIHRLELHAYRCTLEALYASGPLSWEKEALLTNLRISLHISNDEHLMELKNLISAGTGSNMEACNPCFQMSNDDAGVNLNLSTCTAAMTILILKDYIWGSNLIYRSLFLSRLGIGTTNHSDGRGYPQSGISVTAFCIMLKTLSRSFAFQKESVVSRSSAEAIYKALATARCGITWSNGILILHDLQVPFYETHRAGLPFH